MIKIAPNKLDEVYIEASKIDNEKLKYCLKKLSDKIKSINLLRQEEIEDIKIDLCSIDEKGNIIREENGNFKYTKDNLKFLNKQIKEISSRDYEFEPYYFKDTSILTDEQKELFKGIIIE